MSNNYLVTPALPYANGPIHLGHLVEHIQVNIFVNALRMDGNNVLCPCGADSHGTPIEINAYNKNIKPSNFIKKWQKSHELSFSNFGIIYDGGYGTTHTKNHENQVIKIFNKIKKKKQISTYNVVQFFDQYAKRFLPDRLIKGTCPECKSKEQYADICENCGSVYQIHKIINPISIITGTKPILKHSKHYFFELYHYTDKLKNLIFKTNIVQNDIKKFLKKWLISGLKKWDISRDAPYFGFNIPGETKKYFYVWLDAPISYISLTKLAAEKIGKCVKDYWKNKNTKIIHFIGKDIIYFHTLFWPAILMASEYNLPTSIFVHGMLTINGKKMSKSKGTYILADDYIKYLEPEALRYYFATKLGPTTKDLDLNLYNFKSKVNVDLVNKIVNIISRTIPLLHKYNNGKIGSMDKENIKMINKIKIIVHNTKDNYLKCKNFQVIKNVLTIAELANCYIQKNKPWKTATYNIEKATTQITTGLWCGKICIGLLSPILPKLALKMKKILKINDEYSFTNIISELQPGKIIGKYERLFNRIKDQSIKSLIDLSYKNSKPYN